MLNCLVSLMASLLHAGFRETAQFRRTLTAIVDQEGKKPLHPGYVDRIEDMASLSPPCDQPSLFEQSQMPRQCGRRYVKRSGEGARRFAFRSGADKSAKYCYPGIMRQSG